MAEHATCPRCGTDGVPIIYGFPSAAVMDKVEAGRAQMGGCVITGTEPRWACPSYQHRWRTDTPAHTDTPELRRAPSTSRRTRTDAAELSPEIHRDDTGRKPS
ncbi:hypothetical protein [Nocardia sp. XZ_19_385]|uniref:hypothetical protein n=1 Tax=Nocardia sp. XZ_19_385 TaxID=2769488 RepID=UPI001890012F|nr:hypothetical protein [Nocardia sp. XZ_19_385]